MKKFLVFLLLIILVVGQKHDEKFKERKEKMKKRKQEHEKLIAECIYQNETTSDELKKIIEDNKESDEKLKPIYASHNKLPKTDRDIIRICRRKIFDKMREEHKLEKDRMKEKMKKENADNL